MAWQLKETITKRRQELANSWLFWKTYGARLLGHYLWLAPFCAPSNTSIWALYNKCFLQIHISTGPMDQVPSLSQGILTSAWTWALHPVLAGASGDYTGQPLRQVLPLLLSLPCLQHEAARWDIAPFLNKIWVLVPEGRLVGSRDLKVRWVSIPSPMESTMIPASWERIVNLHSCILRIGYRVS
jgi:hypothetical protein